MPQDPKTGKPPRWPSTGDVLWEGGWADYQQTMPAAWPHTVFTETLPTIVILDMTRPDWVETAKAVWAKNGSVFFEPASKDQVEQYAQTLVNERKISHFFPDSHAALPQLAGVRGMF